MRIWVGVHPSELDNQRILAQHNEIHMMLGILRQLRQTENWNHVVAGPWSDTKGLAALVYLHNLIVGTAFRDRGWNHDSPILMETSMSADADEGVVYLEGLFEGRHDGLCGTPKRWPPSWITPCQKVADLMDLQRRWLDEKNELCLQRSITRYGYYRGGQLKGSSTDPSIIPEEEIERYIAHRIKRRAELESNKQ